MFIIISPCRYFLLRLMRKKNRARKKKKRRVSFCYFFCGFFFSRSLDVHLFLSDHFFSLSLSTIFFSEGISMYKCSLFYYNTFNCKQYSYGLTSYQLFFFFWFRRLFNRTLFFRYLIFRSHVISVEDQLRMSRNNGRFFLD